MWCSLRSDGRHACEVELVGSCDAKRMVIFPSVKASAIFLALIASSTIGIAMTETEPIEVNFGSARDLAQRLALVPRLPITVANRMVALRPYRSVEQMVQP